MAKRWTDVEVKKHRKQLVNLYVRKNFSISEISKMLGISQSGVFVRLNRLCIKSQPEVKLNFLNKRRDIKIPKKYSSKLAEFFGIMLGDGHISNFQIVVSLGTKEAKYSKYVQYLTKDIFGGNPKIGIRKADYKKRKYRDVYMGSVELVAWLKSEGLVSNKLESQVNVPNWIFRKT